MFLLHVEPSWISPYVFACVVTLREKGIAFESRELNADAGQTRTPDYLAQTVTGRVPTLVHDGFGLGESTAIIEYLEDLHPTPAVLPKAPRDRARARQLMSWMRSDDTAPIRAERSTLTMFYESERAKAPLSEEGARAAKKLCDVAARVIHEGRPTLFETWSIVDAELSFLLHRLVLNRDPVPANVAAWAAEQWKRPTVRAFVELPRPKLPS